MYIIPGRAIARPREWRRQARQNHTQSINFKIIGLLSYLPVKKCKDSPFIPIMSNKLHGEIAHDIYIIPG